jgi:DNA (cytosine-5)-methyltransferase 1
VADEPEPHWHPAALVKAYAKMTADSKRKWAWWNIPKPAQRNATFMDLIEEVPTNVEWHAAAHTRYVLELMSPVNRRKVTDAMKSGRKMVGAIYRRTRPDENGVKRQRAEIRFDIAGCLRTPAGGSSRQTILVVEGKSIRSRLLSPREAARLMGLSDDYVLPERYNEAYHVCGDGVCVPVVRHIAGHILEPFLKANRNLERIAAE